MIERIKASVERIKQTKPLVLCLTNYVTIDFVANSLLALGAAPLMSESIEEIEELIAISQSLYINIGTLDAAFLERALYAADIAKSQSKPIILDPVGAGASRLRTTAASKLLPFSDIIRGNASEIIALSGTPAITKGVETSHSVDCAKEQAGNLARALNKLVIISGPVDYVTNGFHQQDLPFGSSLMPYVTGMGCAMTAVLSAFATLTTDPFSALADATAYYGLCGQAAEQMTQTPGTFKQIFTDTLFKPDWNVLEQLWNTSEGRT